MQVHKILNYQQRLEQHRKRSRDFWIKEFSWMAVTGLVVVFGMLYGVDRYASQQAGFAGWPLALTWWQVALVIWVVLMLPPIAMMYPTKPDPTDVERDRQLRRAAGMDDTVAK